MFNINRFCLHILLAFTGTYLIVKVIDALPGLEAGISVYLTFPLLIAAMLEGQYSVRALKAAPSTTDCWKASGMMGVATAILFVTATVIDKVFLPGPPVSVPGYTVAPDWSIIAVCAACAVPLLRIGYAIGVRTELRNKQLQDF